MSLSIVAFVERTTRGSLRDRALPRAAIFDRILRGTDDHSVSRRLSLFTFAGRVASAALLYAMHVLLARWMGGFEYGVFALVWVGAVTLGMLACLGMNAAVLRFVPEYLAHGETPLLRGILTMSRLQGFAVATAVAGVGVLGLYVFGDRLASYTIAPLYLGAVMLPMLTVAEIQDGVARAFNWADLGLWPTFIARPLLILVAMGLALRFGASANAVTAMGAVVAATYVASIGQMAWLGRRLRAVVPGGPRRFAPGLWFAITLPIFAVEGFFFLLTNVDVLVVGALMPPDDVAVYFAAAKTLAIVHMVYFAVRAGSAARFSQYYASGDHARLASFVRDTMHWTFWPSLAVVAALVIVGQPMLTLFGPNFAAGYPLLFILSIGLLARASIGPAETLLMMAGEQRISAAIYGTAFFLNVILNFALIPALGLTGAAVATAAVLTGETVVLYFVAARRLGVRASIFSVLRSHAAAEAA